ncbi:DUF2939 domain-containing protein [Roseateles sp. DAIF2]|uniref:DUF2939 domain-containing protein n=1 Tax=Roseateles sp. DAIF2 TaxID=2714952 RepID=UPI0018A25E5D|nr:DUF2939 domain-containing protein [Roseateles sp. DAIF2]QPF76177.1 DUF2939 domain-containing protein [Roseateles sp. DAIF2]
MKFKSLLIALVALAAAGLYATPYLTVQQMRAAAKERDGERLASYVDFPAVRASLKTEVQAKLAGLDRNERGDPTPAAAMGAAVAGALLGPMVDALITPEALGRILQGQQPVSAMTRVGERPAEAPERLETAMGYESPSRFVFSVRRQGAGEEPVDLVLRREGLLQWKLAELRLP